MWPGELVVVETLIIMEAPKEKCMIMTTTGRRYRIYPTYFEVLPHRCKVRQMHVE
jgi:hypothetical protein